MSVEQDLLDRLKSTRPVIEDILRNHPAGLSEYELLRQLKQNTSLFAQDTAGDHRILFQQHFLLFHMLYSLRDEFLRSQTAILEISPLCIRLTPYNPGSADIDLSDPLREYYLDLAHFHETQLKDVEELLAQFWIALSRQESRSAALDILGLCDPVDNQQIQQQYRRLVMQHHPDRGGNTEEIQRLNTAISELLPRSR